MIILNPNGKTPLYQKIYEPIKQKIVSGDYPKAARPNSTSKLAMDLCVGRNIVESAYDQLYAEGYEESKQGSGFMVMDLTKDSLKFPNMVDGRIIDRNDPPQNDKQNSSTAEQKKIIVIDHAGISYSAQTAYSAVGKIHPMLRNNLYANTSWMVAMGTFKRIYAVF